MIDTADILLKAAEDVQSGMWCQGAMFVPVGEIGGITVTPDDAVSFTPEQLGRMKRCATGSISLATILLGGSWHDYLRACERAATWIELPSGVEPIGPSAEATIITYNDYVLGDDPFEAGQQLAEIFRSAAESL